MKHALIGAFVMTFAVSILAIIPVWVYSMRVQPRKSDGIQTATQILRTSAVPRSWASLWQRAPGLVLGGTYMCLSVMWAYYLIDLSGPKSLSTLSISQKFWWACNHTSRRELFTVCGIWMTFFSAALFVFVRSAIGFLRPGASPNGPTIREHFQRSHRLKRMVLAACAVILVVMVRWRYQDLTRVQADVFMAVLLVPIFIAVGSTAIGRVKCPRCGSDLKELQSEQPDRTKRGLRKPWELWDSCPKCHVSFDEPYSCRRSSTPALDGGQNE